MKYSMLRNGSIYSELNSLQNLVKSARAEFVPAKHPKSSYASQKRNKKKRNKKRK